MLHLERDEFPRVLSAFAAALKTGGVLCFSVKAGEGEEWDTRYGNDCPRWFTFWCEADVDGHLRDQDFDIVAPAQEPGGKAQLDPSPGTAELAGPPWLAHKAY